MVGSACAQWKIKTESFAKVVDLNGATENAKLEYKGKWAPDDDDHDDDNEGRINFSVALSPTTTRTRNKMPKQWSHVIVVSAMRRS